MTDQLLKEGEIIYDPDSQATRRLLVTQYTYTREDYDAKKEAIRKKMAGFLRGVDEEELSKVRVDETLQRMTRSFNENTKSTIELYGDPDGNHIEVVRPIHTTKGIPSTRVVFYTLGPTIPRRPDPTTTTPH